VSKKSEHSLDLNTPADGQHYNPFKGSSDVQVKTTNKKKKVEETLSNTPYEKITKDFIKTDRSIFDVVMPFIMDKYSPGTVILYLVLYRLGYGFSKNKIIITDEDLSKRTNIPKRTLSKYRDDLIECHLIEYVRGYKATRKPQYKILLPSQSKSFINKLHKTTNKLHKSVKSSESSIIDNNIDIHTTEVENIVRDFYSKIGKTQKYLTRKMLFDGCKTIRSLLNQGYSIADINGCIEYTIEIKSDVYSISYIHYSISDYLVSAADKKKQNEIEEKEKQKRIIRDKETALENMLMNKFEELPQDEQNVLQLKAEELSSNYIEENNMNKKYNFQSHITNGYLLELMREKFTEVVENW
tara:strand:+ start:260 stop:1324 length:1065 start_codon:yes stop_codon:yes gene_type:complete